VAIVVKVVVSIVHMAMIKKRAVLIRKKTNKFLSQGIFLDIVLKQI
jgi:hypothetical protein